MFGEAVSGIRGHFNGQGAELVATNHLAKVVQLVSNGLNYHRTLGLALFDANLDGKVDLLTGRQCHIAEIDKPGFHKDRRASFSRAW